MSHTTLKKGDNKKDCYLVKTAILHKAQAYRDLLRVSPDIERAPTDAVFDQ